MGRSRSGGGRSSQALTWLRLIGPDDIEDSPLPLDFDDAAGTELPPNAVLTRRRGDRSSKTRCWGRPWPGKASSTTCASPDFEEDCFVVTRPSKSIKSRAADDGLAPLELRVGQRQLVVAVGEKGDEAFRSARPKVERLVETNVLEVARGQFS